MNNQTYKLKDVCNITGGYAFKSSQFIDKGYPLIRIGEISDNKINIDSNTVYINDEIKKYEKYIIRKGDILIALSGATTGKFGIYKYDEISLLNQRVAKLCSTDKILNRYLYHYMNKLKPVIFDKASGCAQPNISTNEIGNIEIFVPEIKKQEKIVKVLDKAQELIDKRKEQIDQLDELVKSRFIEMFGEIKDYVTISEYIESLTAGKSLAGESECKNKVLNTGSVSYDYYDETQVKNLPSDYLPKEEHLVNKGDVLISRMNTAELVGATAYIWKSKDNIYIPDRLWKANFKPNVNPIFVWQLLIQRSTKEKIRRIASGTSGSMKNISKAGLLGIEVINVDIDKQNEFAEFVKQVDKLKFEMEKSLKELEDNFNSLMQKAFKGELF